MAQPYVLARGAAADMRDITHYKLRKARETAQSLEIPIDGAILKESTSAHNFRLGLWSLASRDNGFLTRLAIYP